MSSQMLQTLIVGLIVLAAAAYLGRRWWRTLALARAPKQDGCGGDCGCSPR